MKLIILILMVFATNVFGGEGRFHVFMKNWKGKEVHVYLPRDYMHSGKNYPVLYMHDGPPPGLYAFREKLPGSLYA